MYKKLSFAALLIVVSVTFARGQLSVGDSDVSTEPFSDTTVIDASNTTAVVDTLYKESRLPSATSFS